MFYCVLFVKLDLIDEKIRKLIKLGKSLLFSWRESAVDGTEHCMYQGILFFLIVQMWFRTHKYFTRFCFVYHSDSNAMPVRLIQTRFTDNVPVVEWKKKKNWKKKYVYWKYVFSTINLTALLVTRTRKRRGDRSTILYCHYYLYGVDFYFCASPKERTQNEYFYICIYTHVYVCVQWVCYVTCTRISPNTAKSRFTSYEFCIYIHIHFVRRYLSS